MLSFRRAHRTDAAEIAEMNCRLAQETEDLILPSEVVRNGVLRGLAKGDEVLYWLAESTTKPSTEPTSGDNTVSATQIAGQLMLTREWSDWRDGWIVWLQSVYVKPEFRQSGVFSRLFQHAADQLRDQPDIVAVRLYVEHQNQCAMQTYRRLGFNDSHYLVMEMPMRSRS